MVRERREAKRAEWEATCNQCGLCCYEKRYKNGRLVIDLSLPCPYLDTATRKCTVYENRFRVCMQCRKVTKFHALFSRLMPANCGYVVRYRKWKRLIPTARVHDPAA